MVCGGQGRGQPVAQPPYNSLGVKKKTVQFDGASHVGGPLAGSPPVYEFGFGDREGDSQIPAPTGYSCEGSL